MDKQEVKEMMKVVNDPRPAALSYMAVRSDRTLVVEDADKLDLELCGYLFGAVCSAIAGAVCGAMMALML